MNDKYILRLMKNAVMDNFECDNCGSIIEPDCPVCGLCGWTNPLLELGLI